MAEFLREGLYDPHLAKVNQLYRQKRDIAMNALEAYCSPYVTFEKPDGGFFHPVPESPELFARWFQFGAFCPLFRAHGWVWREHVPWAHGPEVEAA